MVSCTAIIWQWPNTFKGHSMVSPKHCQCWLIWNKNDIFSFNSVIFDMLHQYQIAREELCGGFFLSKPGLHCVDIASQVRGSVWAVRSNHCSAQLPSAHSVWPKQLNCGPRICAHPRIWRPLHFSCNSFCMGLHTLQPMYWHLGPCNLRPFQFANKANQSQHNRKPIPVCDANSEWIPRINLVTNLSTGVQLTINQQWVKQLLGAIQVTNYYLKQCCFFVFFACIHALFGPLTARSHC